MANPCMKIMSHDHWTTLSQFEPNDSWHFHFGICHLGRKNPLMETWSFTVYSGSQLTYKPWPTESIQDHKWCITSATSLLMMSPSLWSRVDLDSSDHMSLFHCSSVHSWCSLANWSFFLISLLKATHLFSPDSLSSLHIVHLLISYSYFIKHGCEFCGWVFYDLISPNG